MVNTLAEQNIVTGNVQSEGLLNTSQVNLHRITRLDKKATLTPELKEVLAQVNTKWTWYVVTEGWCGDASQNLSYIAKMAELNPNIELKLLLRDDNPEIMDAYLNYGLLLDVLLIAQTVYPDVHMPLILFLLLVLSTP